MNFRFIILKKIPWVGRQQFVQYDQSFSILMPNKFGPSVQVENSISTQIWNQSLGILRITKLYVKSSTRDMRTEKLLDGWWSALYTTSNLHANQDNETRNAGYLSKSVESENEGNQWRALREVCRWPKSGRQRSLYRVKSSYDRTVTFLIRTHVSTSCKQATRAAKPPYSPTGPLLRCLQCEQSSQNWYLHVQRLD